MRWIKEKFFSFYWIFLILFLGLYYISFYKFQTIGKELAFLAPFLAFGYFIQKQKLEESKFFLEVFRSFNERYDALNESLNQIMEQDIEITVEQKESLMNYFNLCSEEYLMFKTGYIPIVVWDSWKEGINHFLKDPKVRMVFDDEMLSDNKNSYYGLSLNVIS